MYSALYPRPRGAMPQHRDNSEPPPLTFPPFSWGCYNFPHFQGQATPTLSQWGVSLDIKNNPAPERKKRKAGSNDTLGFTPPSLPPTPLSYLGMIFIHTPTPYMVKKEQIRPSYVGLCLHAITCVVHCTLCTEAKKHFMFFKINVFL